MQARWAGAACSLFHMCRAVRHLRCRDNHGFSRQGCACLPAACLSACLPAWRLFMPAGSARGDAGACRAGHRAHAAQVSVATSSAAGGCMPMPAAHAASAPLNPCTAALPPSPITHHPPPALASLLSSTTQSIACPACSALPALPCPCLQVPLAPGGAGRRLLRRAQVGQQRLCLLRLRRGRVQASSGSGSAVSVCSKYLQWQCCCCLLAKPSSAADGLPPRPPCCAALNWPGSVAATLSILCLSCACDISGGGGCRPSPTNTNLSAHTVAATHRRAGRPTCSGWTS